MDKNFGHLMVMFFVSFIGVLLIYFGFNLKDPEYEATGNVMTITGFLICFINAVYWTARVLKK